jgi:hypothetical protein
MHCLEELSDRIGVAAACAALSSAARFLLPLASS